jgi:hypothetical protein
MEFETMYCRGIVNKRQFGHYDIEVSGRILDDVKDQTIYYIAAAGPDRRASYTGSGLPFANQIQAFDNTPNVGKVRLEFGNSFKIPLITPNSYMVGLGSVTIPPSLFITYLRPNDEKRTVTIKVGDSIPYRSLTYPLDPRPRYDATFYDSQFDLQVKTQEEIFYDSVYPCTGKMHSNFWGQKPPL